MSVPYRPYPINRTEGTSGKTRATGHQIKQTNQSNQLNQTNQINPDILDTDVHELDTRVNVVSNTYFGRILRLHSQQDVKKILASRYHQGKLELFVEWKNSSHDNSWIPEQKINKDLLNAYLKQQEAEQLLESSTMARAGRKISPKGENSQMVVTVPDEEGSSSRNGSSSRKTSQRTRSQLGDPLADTSMKQEKGLGQRGQPKKEAVEKTLATLVTERKRKKHGAVVSNQRNPRRSNEENEEEITVLTEDISVPSKSSAEPSQLGGRRRALFPTTHEGPELHASSDDSMEATVAASTDHPVTVAPPADHPATVAPSAVTVAPSAVTVAPSGEDVSFSFRSFTHNGRRSQSPEIPAPDFNQNQGRGQGRVFLRTESFFSRPPRFEEKGHKVRQLWPVVAGLDGRTDPHYLVLYSGEECCRLMSLAQLLEWSPEVEDLLAEIGENAFCD